MKVTLDTDNISDMMDLLIGNSGLYDKLEKHILWKGTKTEYVKFTNEQKEAIDMDIYLKFHEDMCRELKKIMIDWDEDAPWN